jgi:DNA repair protein RadC
MGKDGRSGHRQRLKERFLAGEAISRTDEAVLELLLTYALDRKDVRPLAEHLLATFGDIHAVLSASIADLEKIDGLGKHTITLIKLVHWTCCQPHSPSSHV